MMINSGNMFWVTFVVCLLDPTDALPMTTTVLPTTTPPIPSNGGCIWNGQFYENGDQIESERGQNDNWCYGAICNDGNVVHWDNWSCGSTTTTPVTTTPPIPSNGGCIWNGQFYENGDQIESERGQYKNWCYGAICNDGHVVYWDSWSCGSTTTTPEMPTTTPPESPPTTGMPTTRPPTSTTSSEMPTTTPPDSPPTTREPTTKPPATTK